MFAKNNRSDSSHLRLLPATLEHQHDGFLYLIVIAFLSLAGDFAASVVTALLAGFCLMYFFAPPPFSILVDDPTSLQS